MIKITQFQAIQRTDLMLPPQKASGFGAQFEKLSKEDRDIVLDRIERELVVILREKPVVRQSIAFGVREVQKCILDHSARIVIFTQQPESSLFNHIPLLCRLHCIPICILHLSPDKLGKLFAMKRLAVFTIKANHLVDVSTDEKTLADYEQKVGSVVKFFCGKASKKI